MISVIVSCIYLASYTNHYHYHMAVAIHSLYTIVSPWRERERESERERLQYRNLYYSSSSSSSSSSFIDIHQYPDRWMGLITMTNSGLSGTLMATVSQSWRKAAPDHSIISILITYILLLLLLVKRDQEKRNTANE